MVKLNRKILEITNPREKADGQQIVEICARQGYEISLADAVWAWGEHSESWCAGWLFIGDDEEVMRYILEFMEPTDSGARRP